jgi:hypothetical protein
MKEKDKKDKIATAAGSGATSKNVEKRLSSPGGPTENIVKCLGLLHCPINSKSCKHLRDCGVNTYVQQPE